MKTSLHSTSFRPGLSEESEEMPHTLNKTEKVVTTILGIVIWPFFKAYEAYCWIKCKAIEGWGRLKKIGGKTE